MGNTQVDYAGQLPVLADWMRGAKHGHPWGLPVYSKEYAKYFTEEHLDVERVLSTLANVRPERLEGKRRDFRSLQSVQELRSIATELSFAARLTRHGVGFDFGAPATPQPDLVLRNSNLGIELTTRRADPIWDLIWHLKQTFGFIRSEPKLQIMLEFNAIPFAIRTSVRDELTAEIRRAAQKGDGTVYCVVRPSLGGQPAITVKATIYPIRRPLGFPRVTYIEDVNRYRVLMADIEDAIVRAMREKRKIRQARAMPTVLVIDVGRVKGSHLRPTSAWVGRLLGLIRPDDEFVGVGLLYGRGWSTESPLILVRNPHVESGDLEALRLVSSPQHPSAASTDRLSGYQSLLVGQVARRSGVAPSLTSMVLALSRSWPRQRRGRQRAQMPFPMAFRRSLPRF